MSFYCSYSLTKIIYFFETAKKNPPTKKDVIIFGTLSAFAILYNITRDGYRLLFN